MVGEAQETLVCMHNLMMIFLFFDSFLSYLPTPLLGQDVTQGQFLSEV